MADSINKIDALKAVKGGDSMQIAPDPSAAANFQKTYNTTQATRLQPATTQTEAVTQTAKVTPMDLAAQEGMRVQMKEISKQNGQVATRLRSQVKEPLTRLANNLTPAQKAQLEKMPQFNRGLQTTNQILRYTTEQYGSGSPAVKIGANESLLDKGIKYVMNAESHFTQAKKQIAAIASDATKSANPAAYLQLQQEVYEGQQMVEYVSVLTANLVKAVNTLFNTQL